MTAAANVAALAKLALSPPALFFPDSDPDTVPLVQASSGPIVITTKARTIPGGRVTLALVASDDLRAGMSTIPVGVLSWTATGSGFVPGTASKDAAQTVGSWIDSGTRSGTQNFVLANAWSYAAGTYTVTLVYTLTAE